MPDTNYRIQARGEEKFWKAARGMWDMLDIGGLMLWDMLDISGLMLWDMLDISGLMLWECRDCDDE